MAEIDGEESPRHVVVGVDHSDNAARAARWAAHEADSRGVPLTVVHALHLPTGPDRVIAPPDYAKQRREDGDELLDRVAEQLRSEYPRLRVDTELSERSAAHTLSALSLESSLIVTGTRGHGGFTGMLLGSVTRKLAAHTHSPLVVVRGDQPADLLDEIVVGIDHGQPEETIRFAFATAQRHGAALHAVHVWTARATTFGPMGTYFSDYTQIRTEERAALVRALEPFRSAFPDVKVQVTAARGNPVPVLVECSRETRQLVVGAHRHHGPLAVGAGYVVEGLLAHSPTPVTVVPTRSEP